MRSYRCCESACVEGSALLDLAWGMGPVAGPPGTARGFVAVSYESTGLTPMLSKSPRNRSYARAQRNTL